MVLFQAEYFVARERKREGGKFEHLENGYSLHLSHSKYISLAFAGMEEPTSSADDDKKFEWELCRENVKPIKQGRRVEAVNKVTTFIGSKYRIIGVISCSLQCREDC